MKTFQKHLSPVTGLGYWCSDYSNLSDQRYNDLRRIISISMNSQVFIHDQDAPQDAKSSCRYIMKQHKDGCNSVSVRMGHEVLATGSEDGSTIITNLISYRHQVLPHYSQTNSQVEQPKPIKHVLFLDPYQALISIDVHGLITFYAVGESKLKNRVLFTKNYETESMTSEIQPFPVTCCKFQKENQVIILGDEFGNIDCWLMTQFIEALMFTKVEKSVLSKRRQPQNNIKSRLSSRENTQSFLITDIGRREKQSFTEDLITRHMKIKQAHTDGITSIELIKQNNAFITSSFDCCCHIWRIDDGTKIGSLLLGGDPKWGLGFNLQSKRLQAVQQADQLLQRLDKRKMMFYSQGLSKDQDVKQYKAMKQTVLKGARDILQYQKKLYSNPQPLIDILGDTNKLQKEFFEQEEEEDNSLNMINQLMMSAQKGKFSQGRRF